MSGTVRIGSHIRLFNSRAQAYLDTCGWVKDEPTLAGQGGTGLVQTSTEADRDNGSGTWEVVSATGLAAQTEIDNTTQIHLRNLYPGMGSLTVRGTVDPADGAAIEDLDPLVMGAYRYVQAARELGPTEDAAVGRAGFALPLVPNPPDHRAVPVPDGATVRLRCYLPDPDFENFYLSAFGPRSRFTSLKGTFYSPTGLVFGEPEASERDRTTWTVSIVA